MRHVSDTRRAASVGIVIVLEVAILFIVFYHLWKACVNTESGLVSVGLVVAGCDLGNSELLVWALLHVVRHDGHRCIHIHRLCQSPTSRGGRKNKNTSLMWFADQLAVAMPHQDEGEAEFHVLICAARVPTRVRHSNGRYLMPLWFGVSAVGVKRKSGLSSRCDCAERKQIKWPEGMHHFFFLFFPDCFRFCGIFFSVHARALPLLLKHKGAFLDSPAFR